MSDDAAPWPKRVAKALLPVPVRRWIQARRGLEFYAPDTWLRRAIDRWAARRVLESIIIKTHNVETVRWLGRSVWQYPLDAWVIQEMLGEQKPDLIVETGTWLGGSAHFFGCLCDLMNHGEVISIDISPRGTMPHPRVTYVTSSSVDPQAVALVAERMRAINARRLLVVLDSDHSAGHVLKELEAYAPLLPVGCYFHVQDGCIDELHILRRDRPGPVVAAKEFLRNHPAFSRDLDVERRYIMTAHPYGWLRRVAEG